MSNATLQEVLLILTFLLTLLNILNSYNASRSRRMHQEPAITDMQKSQIEIHSDIKHIRALIDAQASNYNATSQSINELQRALNDCVVRIAKLEAARI